MVTWLERSSFPTNITILLLRFIQPWTASDTIYVMLVKELGQQISVIKTWSLKSVTFVTSAPRASRCAVSLGVPTIVNPKLDDEALVISAIFLHIQQI
jgi:hypothetical protein